MVQGEKQFCLHSILKRKRLKILTKEQICRRPPRHGSHRAALRVENLSCATHQHQLWDAHAIQAGLRSLCVGSLMFIHAWQSLGGGCVILN